MDKITQLPIGEYSAGTLRVEDLAGTVLGMCETANEIQPDTFSPDRLEGLRKLADGLETPGTDGEGLMWDMVDSLCEFTPPFCHVGMIEGDGACFGVWPLVDWVEEDEDVTRIGDPCELDGVATDFALFINDHGNCTLFQRSDKESDGWETVWDVV